MKVLCIAALIVVSLTASAQTSIEPRYTSDGQLMRPENYREWIFLSSGLGMTYGPAASANPNSPLFDNVFVTPTAYKAFQSTGTWPDKTMFVLEIRSAATEGSINKGGHFQTSLVVIEASVKDEARFRGRWAFFDFGRDMKTQVAALPRTERCYACHTDNGAVDNTFVQFYPTLLEVATKMGTVKAATAAPIGH